MADGQAIVRLVQENRLSEALEQTTTYFASHSLESPDGVRMYLLHLSAALMQTNAPCSPDTKSIPPSEQSAQNLLLFPYDPSAMDRHHEAAIPLLRLRILAKWGNWAQARAEFADFRGSCGGGWRDEKLILQIYLRDILLAAGDKDEALALARESRAQDLEEMVLQEIQKREPQQEEPKSPQPGEGDRGRGAKGRSKSRADQVRWFLEGYLGPAVWLGLLLFAARRFLFASSPSQRRLPS